MNSEKIKEIKKALECMSGLCKDSLSSICFECEIDKKYDEESVCKEALTLINELESENERLLEQRNKTYNIWVKDTEKLKDRIAELEKENAIKTDTIVDLLNKQEFYEKEKLTKFAERLKDEIGDMKQFFRSCLDRDYCGLTEDQIDETLKEFINESI